MKKIKRLIIEEYKYDTEEERCNHIIEMEVLGYETSSQSKKSDDSIMADNREYYWFGQFSKYEE